MNNFDASNDPSLSIAPLPIPPRKSGAPGLVLLFLVYAVVGSLAAVVYILAVDMLPSVFLCAAFAVFYGVLMGHITGLFKRKFNLRPGVVLLLVMTVSLLLVTYVKWNLFFALNDTRYYLWDYNEDFSLFTHYGIVAEMLGHYLLHPEYWPELLSWYNEYGTWGYGENTTENVTGILLAVIWLGEFLILSVPSFSQALGFSKKEATPAPLPDDIWTGAAPSDILPEQTFGYAESPADVPSDIDMEAPIEEPIVEEPENKE